MTIYPNLQTKNKCIVLKKKLFQDSEQHGEAKQQQEKDSVHPTHHRNVLQPESVLKLEQGIRGNTFHELQLCRPFLLVSWVIFLTLECRPRE